MAAVTKDQIRTLSPEQQEALGELELQRLRSRQQLLDRARHYRGIGGVAPFFVPVAGGLTMLSITIPRLVPFAIIATITLIVFYANGFNRRLDAVVELLDASGERKRTDNNPQIVTV